MRFRFRSRFWTITERDTAEPVAEVRPTAKPRTAALREDGGLVDRYVRRRAIAETATPSPKVANTDELISIEPIGRGTFEHEVATGKLPPDAALFVGLARGNRRLRQETTEDSLRQRLIAAALGLVLFFTMFAGTVSAQHRYLVQPGDTLEGIAAEFGVDPEAILRASWLANPPFVTPGDVIIIPDPGQTPEEAALDASDNVGTSPWTVGAYWVESGDSIDSIAAYFGVDPEALLAINGLTWSDIIYPGDRLLIPGAGDEGFEASAAVAGAGEQTIGSAPSLDAYIWVPTHRQEHSLSCEYAAVFIATSAFGNAILESVYVASMPVTSNPHYGYRGDIDGRWGNYDDYGIYAEPLVPILNDYGFAAEVFYSDGDTSQLIAHLDAGHPVITWLGFWGDTGQVYDDEGRYTIVAGMHVMTAYGYSDDGVYFSDPGTGSYRFLDWETFRWMWVAIDGMSLAVYPM